MLALGAAMTEIVLGPLVMDAQRLAAVVGMVVLLGAAEIADRRRRRGGRAGGIGALAGYLVLVWVLAARLAHVALNWPAFAAAPLDVLRVWQGGFEPGWGFAVAFVALLLMGWRAPSLAVPLAGVAALAVMVGQVTALALDRPPEVRLPDLTLTDLAGAEVRLTGPLVLNLWASWCPPCRREMPLLTEMATAPGAPRFVLANQGEDTARIASYLAAEGLAADTIALDPDSALMRALGVRGLPVTLFFAADGRLVASHTGEISRAALTRRMAELTAGQP